MEANQGVGWRRVLKSTATFIISFCLLGSIYAAAQEREVSAEDQTPKETVAAQIPEVVANGTKVELIKSGLQGRRGYEF